MKSPLQFFAVLVLLTGCSTPAKKDSRKIYNKTKTIEHKVKVDLGDGTLGIVTRKELDPKFFGTLSNFKATSLDKPLTPLWLPMPTYPSIFKELNIEGYAEVEMTINGKGIVEKAVIKSSSHRYFGRSVLIAVLSWRFEPLTTNGKPTKLTVRQLFPFRLK